MKFLDEAKIFLQSGKGETGVLVLEERNMLNLVVQMVVTAEMVETLY